MIENLKTLEFNLSSLKVLGAVSLSLSLFSCNMVTPQGLSSSPSPQETSTSPLHAYIQARNNEIDVAQLRESSLRVYDSYGSEERQRALRSQDYTLPGSSFRIQAAGDCCSGVSPQRPAAPTLLFDDNFADVNDVQFANTVDDPSGWTEWGSNYYPTGQGVTLWNPGPGQGPRNNPGEYIFDRNNLLESGLYQLVPLTDSEGVRTYRPGDRLVLKFRTSPTFDHPDSDSTAYLQFDDAAQTIAVSSTLRGVDSQWQELYIDVAIPDCATQVVVNLLGYLGENESSSVTFESVSLEQVPGEYYHQSTLLDQDFDTGVSNAYGENNPDVDSQFGDYNFYLVDDWPVSAGDKAITAVNEANATEPGGLTQRVNLDSVQANESLSVQLYAASTFSDASSYARMDVLYYDSSDTLLKTTSSETIRKSHFRWLSVDRDPIPATAAYAEVTPVLHLGANENSSLLMDDLQVRRVGPSGATAPGPEAPNASCYGITLQDPDNNSQYPIGGHIPLRAELDFAQNGLVVEFQDQNGQLVATGTREPWGTYAATWETAPLGNHSLTAVAKDANGNVLATSNVHNVEVTANQIALISPANDGDIYLPFTQGLQANIQLANGLQPSDVRVNFRANGNVIAEGVEQNSGEYHHTWNLSTSEQAGEYLITATLEDINTGQILASSSGQTLTLRKKVDIAFIFDGGGSLSGYVQSVKENLLDFVDTLNANYIDAHFAVAASATNNGGHPNNDTGDATSLIQDLNPDIFTTRGTIVNFPNIGGTSQDTYSSLVEVAGDPSVGSQEPDQVSRRQLSDGSNAPLIEILVTDHQPEQQLGQFTGFPASDDENREAAVANYLSGLGNVYVYVICETSSFDEYDQIRDATSGGLANIGDPSDMAVNLQQLAIYIRDTL